MKSISLKLFIILSLFFPAFYGPFNEDYKMEYYAVFTLAYGALLVYIVWRVLHRKKKIDGFLSIFLAGILVYNLLSIYINVKYLHWYGEQINNTIAFMFFLCLCGDEDRLGEQDDKMVVFFLRCAVLSNIISIIYFFMGYTSYLICNNQFYFYRLPEDYYEFRHYWIYSHKSDYALMLVAFMAVAVQFRDKICNKYTWGFTMLVFLTAMFLTHSWTGFGAAALVFIGACMDKINWKEFRFRRIYLLGGIIAVTGGGIVLKLLTHERDLFSLGGRLEILSGAVK